MLRPAPLKLHIVYSEEQIILNSVELLLNKCACILLRKVIEGGLKLCMVRRNTLLSMPHATFVSSVGLYVEDIQAPIQSLSSLEEPAITLEETTAHRDEGKRTLRRKETPPHPNGTHASSDNGDDRELKSLVTLQTKL